jgi:hypothetical protein
MMESPHAFPPKSIVVDSVGLIGWSIVLTFKVLDKDAVAMRLVFETKEIAIGAAGLFK